MKTQRQEGKRGAESPEEKSVVLFEIEKAKKAGMNVLLPTTHIEKVSEFHAPVLDYVQLSPEPKDGDVYYHAEMKLFAPTKQGLMKLSGCAGIIWDPERTTRIDNRADRNYIAYQAVGGVKKADGTVIWIKQEYDMDFEVIEEELREQYQKKARDNKQLTTEKARADYVNYCVKRDMLKKRKFKVRLCEAGAMNRVVRALLGLKAGYTRRELEKPFVVARIVFRPDYSDPKIRELMIQESIKSMTGIYGPPKQEPIVLPCNEEPEVNIEPAPDMPWETPEPSEEPTNGLSQEKADFLAVGEDEQVEILKILAERKGYDLRSLTKDLHDFTAKQREMFFDKLTGMPGVGIPF